MNDLIENPSTRCACMLVLDTSGSMSGSPINELNQGLKDFLQAIREDEVAMYSVDLGIISTGGGTPRIELNFTGCNSIEVIKPLSADGGTPLGSAVNLALDALEKRKSEYKRNGVTYYQPWLVIISDGCPDFNDPWQSAAQKSYALSSTRKLVVLPVGVKGADLSILSQFSNKGAKELQGLKFREFFEWLSASMSRVSASNSTAAAVPLPSADPWACV